MVAVKAASPEGGSIFSLSGRQPVDGRTNPREVEFLRDQLSGRVAVRSVDKITGKELSCIPPRALLATLASIRKAIGLLLDLTM